MRTTQRRSSSGYSAASDPPIPDEALLTQGMPATPPDQAAAVMEAAARPVPTAISQLRNLVQTAAREGQDSDFQLIFECLAAEAMAETPLEMIALLRAGELTGGPAAPTTPGAARKRKYEEGEDDRRRQQPPPSRAKQEAGYLPAAGEN